MALLGALVAGCELDTGEEPFEADGRTLASSTNTSESAEEPAPQAAAESEVLEEEALPADPVSTNALLKPEQTVYAQQRGIDNSRFYGETFSGTGCEQLPLTDGGGGFVSNPANLRGTLKFVFPVSYQDRISRVTLFTADGMFFDEMYRQLPNEADGRPRYYGTMHIEVYPPNLYLRVIMNDGSCRSLQHPDPQTRYD